MNPDGTLDFTAPSDRPFDWTASGDPRLLARTFGFLVTDAGLREVKTYADGIGPWKRYIVSSVAAGLPGPGEASRKLLPPTDVIQRAHKAGLFVHTWTFRNEQKRLVSDYQGNPVNEYLQFYRLGIDGLFSDFAEEAPDLLQIRRQHHALNSGLAPGRCGCSRDQKQTCSDRHRTDGSRNALTAGRYTFDGDGGCHDSHCAQIHDARHQQDRHQTDTAPAAMQAEAHALPPSRAGDGR